MLSHHFRTLLSYSSLIVQPTTGMLRRHPLSPSVDKDLGDGLAGFSHHLSTLTGRSTFSRRSNTFQTHNF